MHAGDGDRGRHPLPPAPHDVFGLKPSPATNALRFRVWPETEVGLTLVGKKPGAGWTAEHEELAFAGGPGRTCGPTTG